MTIWAPVVAAIGASFLTGGFTWGVSWWQERRRDRAATIQERAAAYHELTSRSLSFIARVNSLRNAMQSRSGLKEGVDITLRYRRPVDALEIHDWLTKDFEPINNAWSRIQLLGTAAAIDAATQLLNACGDVVGAATSLGRARGKIASTVIGLAWTEDQQEELQAANKRAVAEREAFIKVARKELGAEKVTLPSERANQPDPSVEGPDERARAPEVGATD
jgi:hypothetical protein